jgi:FkbM family methyltransferase
MLIKKIDPPRLSSDGIGTVLTFGTPADFFRFSAMSPGACAWLKSRCAHGYHEPVMSELVVDFMGRRPRSTFLDIGACFGYFGLLALAASRGEASVYAFEMNPDNFKQMERNFGVNPHLRENHSGAGFIHGVHAALGNVDQTERPTSFKGFNLDTDDADSKHANIDFVKLDSFLRTKKTKVDLIKIDVEGYETHVLAGAMEMIHRDKPVILLELHHNKLLSKQGTTRVQLLERLVGEGLRAYLLGHQRRAESAEVVELTGKVLSQQRSQLDSRGDELVVICSEDIAHIWPGLTTP